MFLFELIKTAYLTLVESKIHSIIGTIKKHNETIFPATASRSPDTPIVLVELNEMQSAHIAYGYLANQIADNNNARIIGYKQSLSNAFRDNLIFEVKKRIGYKYFGIYKSFGTSEFITIRTNRTQRKDAKNLFGQLLAQIQSKSDLVDLTVDGVWVGDLIYDSFLKEKTLPTLDFQSIEFLEHLQKSVEYFIFWRDYFTNNNVSSIITSHTVYSLAIPLRIAVKKKIPAYQASLTHVYRLSNEEYFAYNDFFHYHKDFVKLPVSIQTAGLEKARLQIERRFSGEVGVNMAYSKKSAFTDTKHENLIRNSTKKKILVAAHCFFDSPHPYGKNLFPDCWEWLNFLGKMSKETDYDWYIKTHPDFIPANKGIIEEFIRGNPKFLFLPSNASHHQIIKEGIDVALTIYGTIGFEYAALGVPVINASRCNPHIAYNFNLHPKSIEEYQDLIVNLDTLNLPIERKEVYEYYFMRHLYNTENLFFDDYQETLNKLGGYKEQFTPEIYKYWLKYFSEEKHESIQSALSYFISSGEYRMNYTHFNKK